MKHSTIRKICERCEGSFEIPNTKKSRARELLLQFYPCIHCGFVKDIKNPKFNRSGRCASCFIPFTIIDHHARGMCSRCCMAQFRNKSTDTL